MEADALDATVIGGGVPAVQKWNRLDPRQLWKIAWAASAQSGCLFSVALFVVV